jgi:hypothetical protein
VLGIRLIRENPNPYFASTLDKSSHRNTSCFNMSAVYPSWLKRLKAVFPEINLITSRRKTIHPSTLRFSPF